MKIKYIIIAIAFLMLNSCNNKTNKNLVVNEKKDVLKGKDKAVEIPPIEPAEYVEYECEEFVVARAVKNATPNMDSHRDYPPAQKFNTEEYDNIEENNFKSVAKTPLSTLSIDVDNASYSNVRRYLIGYGEMPPKNSVRIEEMINYFTYDYPDAKGEHPFEFITEYSQCPWNSDNMLLHIGIQGKKLDYKNLKPSNLVFLLDVSGSMSDKNKLPLLKKSMNLLINQLDDRDKISIVVYAGSAGLVLPPTPATQRQKIKDALNKLEAGGGTAGGEGIKLAYKVAEENFMKDGNNRIILATDGDFNLGISSTGAMVDLIKEEKEKGVFLTILGMGMGNYKDGRMEQISNAGNGNYFYIDNIREAEKVFVKELRANMFTIAKDVKIQIEFNPVAVKSYRLIGYENRVLNTEDFDDDKKDAGELGAGHTVTALYEIVPANKNDANEKSDLKYSDYKVNQNAKNSGDLMTIKFRYKPIKSNKSILIEKAIPNVAVKPNSTSNNFNFSSAVASFGMILRGSKHKGRSDYKLVETLAKKGKGKDENGYRSEFIKLVHTAKLLNEK